jgi:hypothetical protein
MKETLETLLNRYQHLSDYAETKLGVLIAFNSALIFGLVSIYNNQNPIIQYVIMGIVLLNLISLFFGFSGVFAKTKNNHSGSSKSIEKNYFYHEYVAQLNESAFLENLKKDYNLESINLQIEKDFGNQIVVLAKNANRKFKYFNIAINFTLASILTPIGLLIFHIYNNPN